MSLKNTPERLMVDENSYNSPHYLRHKIAYMFAEKFIKDKIVIDTACGSGYGSYHLITSGAKKVTGTDISKKAIEYARQRYKVDNLRFEVMDATKLNFDDDTFDVFTSFQTIEHIKNVDKFLTEIKRVLKKTGTALISTPNKITYSPNTSEPENPFHIKEYYLDEFKYLLNNYFDCVNILGVSQSQKIEKLEKSFEYSIKKNFLGFLKKLNLSFLLNIIPKKIRNSLRNKLNKNVGISDFMITELNPDKALDFMAICKNENGY